MPESPDGGFSDDVDDIEALGSVLDRRERAAHIVHGVGCLLVLTNRRLILVRDGANFRPRTGVRTWAIEAGLDVRIARSPARSRRIEIRADGATTSVFVRASSLEAVAGLIACVRKRIHRGT